MAPRNTGRHSALDQTAGMPRPLWHRVPQPAATAALAIWSLLPPVVRKPFLPVGRWINPHHTTAATTTDPEGPDTVDGVTALREQGFAPIEEYTGATWVGQLWPEDHRRWLPETRSAWLDATNHDGRLWLVRSPWPSLSLQDTLNVLWSWAERDRARLTPQRWRDRVSEALAWDDATAADWHRRTAG